MDKFKEGRMTILRLIRFFDKKGEDETYEMLIQDYLFPRDEAMEISDLISQLSSLKADYEDWFEEYPLSDLIDNLENENCTTFQQQTTTTTTSAPSSLMSSKAKWPGTK